MDDNLSQQLKEAEASIAQAEQELGPEHLELADRLMRYAALLRQTERRTLDAVNVEARAKAIRAKHYAAEAAEDNRRTTTTIIKPKQEAPAGPGMYFGLAGLLVSLSSLFLTQSYFKFLAPLAVVLVLVDVVATRGGGWWRALLSVIFVGSAWFSINSVPPIMLVDATPMERFSYASENPDLVDDVKKLGKIGRVLSYQIALPTDYKESVDEKRDWGRVIGWKSEQRPDQTYAEFYIMRIKPDGDDAKKFRTMGITQIAKTFAMPRIQDEFALADFEQDLPKLESINRFEFARIGFRGRREDHARRGFAYIAKERNTVLALVGIDYMPQATQTLEPLEAAVYTFSSRGAPEAL